MSKVKKIWKDIINIIVHADDAIIVNEKSISIKSKYWYVSHRFEWFWENPKHHLYAPKFQKDSLLKVLNLCKSIAIDRNMRSFLILWKNLEIIDIWTDY